MAVTLEQFRKQLIGSGLMTAEGVTAFVDQLADDQRPADAEALAKQLVAAGRLTPFQAHQIWKGRGRHLVLGNYVIAEKLGEGGMGMVFKASHKLMKRDVALKVLSPAVIKQGTAVRRFLREVQAAAKLTHPNIVAAHDADQSGGTYYLIMEYVEGRDLSEVVKKQGPARIEQAIDCILQAARGLEYAHRHGVIHRDIKPANLLLDKSGTVKVLDMGLARFADDGTDAATQAGLTGTGTIMGTIDFMAPEQAEDTKRAGPQADIYSLGASLYFLLTGKSVVTGDTLGKKLKVLMTGVGLPQSISGVRSGVSAELDAIFRKMTAVSLEDRYQTMTEVIADLEAVIAGAAPGTASVPGIQPVAAGRSDDSAMQSFLNKLDGDSALVAQSVLSPAKKTAAAADTMANSVEDATRPALALKLKKGRGAPSASALNEPENRTKVAGGLLAAAALVVLLGLAFAWSLGGGDGEPAPADDSSASAGGSADAADGSTPDVTSAFEESPQAAKGPAVVDRETKPASTEGQPAGTPVGTSDYRHLTTGKWIRVFADGPPETADEAVEFKDGVLELNKTILPLPHVAGRNLLVRAWVKKQSGQNAGLRLRRLTNEDYSLAWMNSLNHVGIGGAANGTWRDLRTTRELQPPVVPDDDGFVEMTLAAIDDRLSLYLNGRMVIDVVDSSYGESTIELSANNGLSSFKNVEVMLLDPPPPAVAPFDEAAARKHQQAWGAHLGLPVEKEIELPGGETLTLVLIPPGEFLMGSSDEEQAEFVEEAKAGNDQWAAGRIPLEGPRHRVRVTRPFYLGRHEVTQAQWQSVIGNNPSNFKETPAHPVEQVSWNDVQPFLAKLNESRSAGELTFALPTEAQWEYACRAGTRSSQPNGDLEAALLEHGWFQANSERKTHPVGRLQPNPFGLYDMQGNVWEWCADWFAADYYATSPADDPGGPSAGSHRVYRGGGWGNNARICRPAYRDHSPPGLPNIHLGFRLAAVVAAK